MAGYKILVDNSKKNEILQMEGICPCCNHYPSMYTEKTMQQGKRQFLYFCHKCGSKWEGNIYGLRLEPVISN